MTYKDEFPDYESDIPPVFLAAPWEDASWHNDACPSFALTLADRRGVHVYVGEADPAKREVPGSPRFTAFVTDAEGAIIDRVEGLDSDDLNAVLDYATAQGPDAASIAKTFADMLLDDLGQFKFAEMRRRNRAQADPQICHSHDFCDANVLMEAALAQHGIALFNEEYGDISDAVMRLWGEAWNIASARYLTEAE